MKDIMFNQAVRDIYFNSCLQLSRACNRIIELTDRDSNSSEEQSLADVTKELAIVEHHWRKMDLLTVEVQKRLKGMPVVNQPEVPVPPDAPAA